MKRAIVGAIALGACLYGQSSTASVPVEALSMQVFAVPVFQPNGGAMHNRDRSDRCDPSH
jgi:hypothetical protein